MSETKGSSMGTVLLVLSAIEAAMSAAPGVIGIIEKGKALFGALFDAKLITVEQQNALNARIDAHAQLVASGIYPPHWAVESDPAPEH